ncbi:MAG: hypothetical protein GQ558_02105 [Thermoplasmata archaeon]|nr:hypothetical protein [Thermoplasmata archaeon]
MVDNTPMRTASISHLYYLILIIFIAFHCIYSEDVAGQESEVHLDNYMLFYNSEAENRMSLFPEGANGNIVIPRNSFNPPEPTERIVFIAPMHVEEYPLIIDGTVTAYIHATGTDPQIETEFIVTIHGEDPDMYENVEFRSGPVQLTKSPQLITFTSPAINWIIEPEGLFTIRVNCTHLGGEAYLNFGNYKAGTHFSIRGNFISLSNVSFGNDGFGTGVFSDPFQIIQESDTVSIIFLLYPDQSINYRAEVIIENDDNPGHQSISFPLPNKTYHGIFETFVILDDGSTVVLNGPYEQLELDIDDGYGSSSIASLYGLIIIIIFISIIALIIGYVKKDILYSYYKARIKKSS